MQRPEPINGHHDQRRSAATSGGTAHTRGRMGSHMTAREVSTDLGEVLTRTFYPIIA